MNYKVVCSNDYFDKTALKFYSEHGVIVPEKGKPYTFREVYRHITGDVGVTLEELKNPTVPINDPILGIIHKEPTWSIDRFRESDESEINVEEEIKNNKQTKEISI